MPNQWFTFLSISRKMMNETPKSAMKVETLYDKLNNLADEISEGIINLGDGSRELIQAEIGELREQAYKERSPEAVYNTLLFRKYAYTANKIKDSSAGQKDKTTLVGELPNFVYEADNEDHLVGHQSTKTNIFRLRAMAALFSMIAFSVMASAPYVNASSFSPNSAFQPNCPFKGAFSGSFDFRAYQLVIAVGVLAWLHNGYLMIYYYLPRDLAGNKYIPGASFLLGKVITTPGTVDAHTTKLSEFTKAHGRFLELVSDALLACFGIIAYIVGQTRLDGVTDFTVEGVTQYYTLSSCYETFTHQTPSCLMRSMNPVSRIRGSLAMLFFATLFLLLCFLVSLRSFRQDKTSGLFSGALGLDGSVHTDAGAGAAPAPAGGAYRGVSGTSLSHPGSLNNSAHNVVTASAAGTAGTAGGTNSNSGSTHGPMHNASGTVYEDYTHIGSKL